MVEGGEGEREKVEKVYLHGHIVLSPVCYLQAISMGEL